MFYSDGWADRTDVVAGVGIKLENCLQRNWLIYDCFYFVEFFFLLFGLNS